MLDFVGYIKARRNFLELTQKQLADLAGVDRSTLANWEQGRNPPGPNNLNDLAKALRVNAEDLEELRRGRRIIEPRETDGGSLIELPHAVYDRLKAECDDMQIAPAEWIDRFTAWYGRQSANFRVSIAGEAREGMRISGATYGEEGRPSQGGPPPDPRNVRMSPTPPAIQSSSDPKRKPKRKSK